MDLVGRGKWVRRKEVVWLGPLQEVLSEKQTKMEFGPLHCNFLLGRGGEGLGLLVPMKLGGGKESQVFLLHLLLCALLCLVQTDQSLCTCRCGFLTSTKG